MSFAPLPIYEVPKSAHPISSNLHLMSQAELFRTERHLVGSSNQ